ncbi:hypothetical protein WwAna1028, partial [Wolbachia endosymbiont of Drosophila ananassae]
MKKLLKNIGRFRISGNSTAIRKIT